MALSDIPAFVAQHYEIHEWRHASAVLVKDYPQEWADIMSVLTEFRLKKSHIAVGGGNKSSVATAIDSAFRSLGWVEKHFDTRIVVDQGVIHSPTHKVDEYKNGVAVELEWNNKDPFFDRDLNNFRLLFDLRVVSVGVIITRTDELQELFDALGRGAAYGMATTHMSKLLPKLEGGGGGGCPVLVFGITKRLYVESE
ncbi:MAG: restriction endonuclease [Anaerolineae bacterium]|nr:restriction endonuclease [Anaerolineae bacterium]